MITLVSPMRPREISRSGAKRTSDRHRAGGEQGGALGVRATAHVFGSGLGEHEEHHDVEDDADDDADRAERAGRPRCR